MLEDIYYQQQVDHFENIGYIMKISDIYQNI